MTCRLARSSLSLASLDSADMTKLEQALAELRGRSPSGIDDGFESQNCDSLRLVLSRSPAACADALARVQDALEAHGDDDGGLLVDDVLVARSKLLFAAARAVIDCRIVGRIYCRIVGRGRAP